MLNVEILRFLHRLSFLSAIGVMLLGGTVLFGWVNNLPALYSIAPGLPPMTPATAFSFVFAGGALLLLQPANPAPFRLAVAQVLAAGGILVGLLMLLSPLHAIPAYVLQQGLIWLGLHGFAASAGSPLIAVAFIMTSIALLLLSLERQSLVKLAQLMALASVMLLVMVFFGYAHQEPLFTLKLDMALHTATAFSLLGWGIILAKVENGLFSIMVSARAGGLVMRKVMLLMALFPPVLGWLPILLGLAGLPHREFVPLLATMMVLGVIVIVIRLAFRLDKAEALREQAEDVSRQHQADLAHMARLNSMGEMASGIAHEINQPLTAIANYASACQRFIQAGQQDSKRLLEPLGGIQKQAVRASEIIRRLREFVRKQQPNKARVDLHDLIHDGLMLLKGESVKHGVPILLELDKNMPDVYVDAIQIEQVILNIVQNALDAVRAADAHRRQVVVRCYPQGAEVQVDITDTGPGMDEELRQRVFDAFVTTKGAKGMGIGLSLCRSIVESHGGQLWVVSEPGQGATFSFTLPIGKI